MARVPSRDEQVRRYKARIRRSKIIGTAAQLILRVIMLAVTLACFYTLIFDEDAAKIKGVAAAVQLGLVAVGQLTGTAVLGR